MTKSDLDIDDLVKRMALEDEDDVREVVGFFIEAMEPRLAELERAVAAHDPVNTRHHAHAAKGAAASVGADQMADHLIHIEQSMANPDWTDIEARTKELPDCLDRVRASLDNWVPDFD